jgi:hypothetical protein
LVEYIESMQLNGVYNINLTNAGDDGNIPDYLNNKIKELIIKRNESFYLGNTIRCGNGEGFPTTTVCFALKANTPLRNKIYLTIIGRDLDFIYSTRMSVSSFWDQGAIQNYPFESDTETNISFMPMDDSSGSPQTLSDEILGRLRESGNLVFINPDGE